MCQQTTAARPARKVTKARLREIRAQWLHGLLDEVLNTYLLSLRQDDDPDALADFLDQIHELSDPARPERGHTHDPCYPLS